MPCFQVPAESKCLRCDGLRCDRLSTNTSLSANRLAAAADIERLRRNARLPLNDTSSAEAAGIIRPSCHSSGIRFTPAWLEAPTAPRLLEGCFRSRGATFSATRLLTGLAASLEVLLVAMKRCRCCSGDADGLIHGTQEASLTAQRNIVMMPSKLSGSGS